MAKRYWVYIITNKTRSTLYIGVTNNIERRMHEHAEGTVEGFSKRYRLRRLVYAEEFSDIHSAIESEKRLKKWRRAWKERLIEEENPTWRDLLE